MASEIVIAVDPSLKCTGVAIFRHNLLVHVAELIPVPRKTSPWLYRAADLTDQLKQVASHYGAADALFAGELPQFYGAVKSKGNPNDLAKVTYLLGMYNQALRGSLLIGSTLLFNPGAWVAATSKQDASRRNFVTSRLQESEHRWAQKLGDDGIDAIGIGLHALGRTAKRRAYHEQPATERLPNA